MLNKSQKLGLGIALLLIVDVIWVASSEATKVSHYLGAKFFVEFPENLF